MLIYILIVYNDREAVLLQPFWILAESDNEETFAEYCVTDASCEVFIVIPLMYL